MHYLVDENGEVKEVFNEEDHIAKLKNGDRVIRGGSVEYLLGTISVRFNKFIKVNDLACIKLKEYGNDIFQLFQYVGFGDGILAFSNGRRLRPKFLYGLFSKKRRKGETVVKQLVDLDLLHKHKDGKTYYFTFNPYVAIKGTRISTELYEEFKNTKYKSLGDDFPDIKKVLNNGKD